VLIEPVPEMSWGSRTGINVASIGAAGPGLGSVRAGIRRAGVTRTSTRSAVAWSGTLRRVALRPALVLRGGLLLPLLLARLALRGAGRGGIMSRGSGMSRRTGVLPVPGPGGGRTENSNRRSQSRAPHKPRIVLTGHHLFPDRFQAPDFVFPPMNLNAPGLVVETWETTNLRGLRY